MRLFIRNKIMSEDKIGYCLDCEGADSGHPECVKLNEPVKVNSYEDALESIVKEAIESDLMVCATRKNAGGKIESSHRYQLGIKEPSISLNQQVDKVTKAALDNRDKLMIKNNLNKVCGKQLDTQDGQVYINDSLIAKAEHKINVGISLNSNIEQTIATRGENYGVFADGAAIMRDLKSVMHSTDGWERLNPSQQEALDMIQHKIGRVLNGKPDYDDNWRDIAGYATLVLNELTNQ
ncbi:thymidylate synthase [Yersinia phage vB_YenS_P400]|nr:thymidylate synthase [Yersinia phage vB_YenS_P400]